MNPENMKNKFKNNKKVKIVNQSNKCNQILFDTFQDSQGNSLQMTFNDQVLTQNNDTSSKTSSLENPLQDCSDSKILIETKNAQRFIQ